MKRTSTLGDSLVIREIKIKNIIYDTITYSSEWPKLKRQIIPSVGKDMEQLKFCTLPVE